MDLVQAMDEKVHIITGKRTSHAEARRIAEELGKPVMYWPWWPRLETHVVYPPTPSEAARDRQ